MVQERTAKYVERLGYELRDLVGNNEGRQEGFMDLSLLKYRERDQLEEAFKGYRRKAGSKSELSQDGEVRPDFDMQVRGDIWRSKVHSSKWLGYN